MPTFSSARTRNRSSSNAYANQEVPPSYGNQYHTPLIHHVSAVHQTGATSNSPLRPTSVTQNGAGMSAASRYAHNLKVLRRRDPSILRIFDQFSHVCVYHHNGQHWEKKGFEGSMFLYERADYPPYGFYILNRMGMDDYIQRLWPEDNISVNGSYLMLRTWPEWSRKRISDIEAANGGKELDPFDVRYKWDEATRPNEATEKSQTVGLWMFATDSREPLITVMLRLHGFIKQNVPYPEEFRYGPDKPPPPNPFASVVNGTPNRTPSAASTGSGVSAASTSHTGSSGINSSSQSRSQRHSPNMAYINPLLYQVTDSASTASANLKPSDSVAETPKLKGKNKRRKGKVEKVLTESGDVTPMASGLNQVSDLNMLFAKLAQPAASVGQMNVDSGSGHTSFTNGNLRPSFLETLMDSGSHSNPALSPTTASSSQPPPVDRYASSKLTLEGLFASALSSRNDHEAYDAHKNTSKEDGSIMNQQQQSFPDTFDSSLLLTNKTRAEGALGHAVQTARNTGLALLNDIFASASTSGLASSIMPDSISQENVFHENKAHPISNIPANTNTRTDEPETIEIYSPRPQAPLSLVSMFDAAARDTTPSPTDGLGLGLGVEQDIEQGHQMMLTQQVLDTLLGTGGSTDLDEQAQFYERRSNGHASVEEAADLKAPVEVNDTEPEEIRRTLLHMIGLSSHSDSYHHPEVNGDATPRLTPKDFQAPLSNSFGVREYFKQSNPPADVPFADTEDVLDEVDEDDEAIVELDFSDTRALSDLRIFENRERALREQLVERKVASRNASRSTTPAVPNYTPTANKARGNLNGVEVNGVDQAPVTIFNGDTRPATTSLPTTPETSFPTVSPINVAARLPAPPHVSQKVSYSTADAPATHPVQNIITADKTLASIPPKKKIRRGRGRGKEKDRGSKEGSPVPDVQSYDETLVNKVGNATFVDAGVGQQVVKVNESLVDEFAAASPSPCDDELIADTKVSSEINTSLLSALLKNEKYKLDSKEDLLELALRLLQTDKNFVDELWHAWKKSTDKLVTIVSEKSFSATSSLVSPVGALEIASDHLHEQSGSASKSTLPHLALTQSAPAKLPTLHDDGVNTPSPFNPVFSALLQSDFDQSLSGSIVLASVKDATCIEAERERATIFEEANVTETMGYGDEEDEGYVVETLL